MEVVTDSGLQSGLFLCFFAVAETSWQPSLRVPWKLVFLKNYKFPETLHGIVFVWGCLCTCKLFQIKEKYILKDNDYFKSDAYLDIFITE